MLLRLRLCLAVLALTFAAGAPAQAQSGLPCDAFVKKQDGSVQAIDAVMKTEKR